MIYLEGPAVSVSLEHPAYTFGEDAGAVDVVVVARAAPGIPHVTDFLVSFLTAAGSATSGLADSAGTDYLPVSRMVQFDASDFRDEGGSLVARADEFVTIIDDDVHEGDELFHLRVERSPGMPREVLVLDSQGLECSPACANPYRVTIVDNDAAPTLRLSVSSTRISELGTTASTVTIASAGDTKFADDQSITVSFGGPATFGVDYTVSPADADTADGYQVILPVETMATNFTITAVGDTEAEPCDRIVVSARYGDDGTVFGLQQEIVIVDQGATGPDGITSLTVGLENILNGALTSGDEGRNWYSFTATADTHYIIEVKHPMTFTPIDEKGIGGNPEQVPGYLVDPSILAVTDDNDTQLLDERDQGGFTLNFARAFFTPGEDGTYHIKVGAGAQDRRGLGCYTVSVRVDDHADDYRTDPSVVILPGESLTATIDTDVAKDDPGLNPWDWKINAPLRQGQETDGVVRPRRGIESLDDRDVFRYQIAEAGTYRVSVSDQPTGVGIWYVWDKTGNTWLSATTAPVASFDRHHEPGTYHVEIGTPYESTGNTGSYTVSVKTVTDEGNGGRSTGEARTSAGIALAP